MDALYKFATTRPYTSLAQRSTQSTRESYLYHMGTMSIRKAVREDVESVLRIYSTAGIESERPFTLEEALQHFEVFRRYPSYSIYVVEVDGAIVATYALLLMDNLAKRGKKSGIVEDVAVSPDHQGQGIGRAMMEHAMQQCRDVGCHKMVLSSGLQRTKAHDFYDSTGFERHGFSFRVVLQ
jgi:GNAT superfamily N-acetyltransferase